MSDIFIDLDRVSVGPIQQVEEVSRWLYLEGLFNVKSKKVYARAFGVVLSPISGRFETSVYRTSGLPNDKIWDLASPRGALKCLARAELHVSEVNQIGLDVVPEPSVHERHANIVGWSTDEPDRLQKRAELALQARLHLR